MSNPINQDFDTLPPPESWSYEREHPDWLLMAVLSVVCAGVAIGIFSLLVWIGGG